MCDIKRLPPSSLLTFYVNTRYGCRIKEADADNASLGAMLESQLQGSVAVLLKKFSPGTDFGAKKLIAILDSFRSDFLAARKRLESEAGTTS